MNKNSRVTLANYKMITRGQTIRIETVGGGYVTISRTALREFLEIYGRELAVFFQMNIKEYCYLSTVSIEGEGEKPDPQEEQPELPF